MTQTLDEYCCELINEILFATSQKEVRLLCDATMNRFSKQHTNDDLVIRFVEKMIKELSGFNPISQDAQQWSNIQMARIHFNSIKQRLSKVVN